MNINFKIPYYPSLMDPDIREKLYRKKEFHDIYKRLKQYRENPVPFDRNDLYRDFICQFLAPCTPYDRCLIIHSVGTGKTGCAIRVVEQYKKTFRKAVILNKSDTSTHNFQMLLLKYFEHLGVSERDLRNEGNFYVFDTYNKFAKSILRTSRSKLLEEYECTVFILDEVHNIITNTHEAENAIYTTLLDLFDMLTDCVVVGMTATPMRDRYTEIIPLLNMFVKNPNNRIPENPESFDKIQDSLIQIVKSSVSWYTEQFGFTTCDIGHVLLNLHMPIVLLQMGVNQVMAYTQLHASDLICRGDLSSNFMDKDRTYVSLGAFESEGAVVKDSVVEIVQTHNKKRMLSYEIANHRDEILARPHDLSCKFAYTMEHIECDDLYYTHRDQPKPLNWPTHNKLCDGLIYIFCEDITNTGIKTIIALFRLFGYEYYLGGNIDSIGVNPRRFTVYVGDRAICSNGTERLDLFCDPRNLDGKYCKIIIASNVMKESVSLKGIRKVFIWTPHWNYSSIVQAQGRAIRKDAFIDMLRSQDCGVEIHRLVAITAFSKLYNVIHLYNSQHDEQNLCREIRKVSIDLYKYYRSSIKQDEINKVECILSTMSLDNYVISNPSLMPDFADKLDMSTYVQYDDAVVEVVKAELYEFLKEGPEHILSVIERLADMKSISLDTNNILKYIDIILSGSGSVEGKFIIPHFIHIRNDVLYISSRPVEQGYAILPNVKAGYVKHIDTYIDKSEYAFPHFNWDLDKRTIANNIEDVYPYIVDICERAVIENHPKVLDMFCFNVHKIVGQYFHVLERNMYTNTRYSNTSKSTQNTVLVKHYNSNTRQWKFIDNDIRNYIGTRIDLINRFRSLEYIIRYSVYGSISITDGQLRIHNYITKRLNDINGYISKCRQMVNLLCTIPNLSHSMIADTEREYRQSITLIGTIDRRNDMRGRNINTFSRKHIATIELLLLVKALGVCITIPDTIFYCGTSISTKGLDEAAIWNMTEHNDIIQELMRQYPDMSINILIKYYELVTTSNVNDSKSRVESLVINNDLYIFD